MGDRGDPGRRRIGGIRAGIAAAGSLGAFLPLHALHVRDVDLLFAPFASTICALFSNESRRDKMWVHLTIFAGVVSGIIFDNIIPAYHLQPYQWPIELGFYVPALCIAWVVGRGRRARAS